MQPLGEATGETFEEEEDKSVGEIARKWLNRLNTDKTFGINKIGKHHYIGDTHVIVKENNNIFIDDEEFEGTPGLWKLIMSKYPMDGDFTSKDYENYGRILVKTHVLHQGNNPNSPYPKSSKSEKWGRILADIWKYRKEFGCKGEFDDKDKNKKKVKDHCHFTGRYRGAAHNKCNLDYRKPNFTPVVFHNLSGYDSHLFIKDLCFSKGDIDCIPNNKEKYISFSKKIQVGTYPKKALDAEGDIFYEQKPIYHTIRFIDSFKFMATSLDKLANNLPEDDFINLGLYYSGDKFNLLARKGVYPYEYMDSLEKLKETELPPKEAFYSRLNDGGISDEDYAHAQKVWGTFKMEYFKTITNYIIKLMFYF